MTDRLMHAVLALDAYNRGYDPGLRIEPGATYDIGKMSITKESDTLAGSQGVNIGFYAAAYQGNGETIISFRGTDDIDADDLLDFAWQVLTSSRDARHGWPLALGSTNSQQAQMAARCSRPAA
ncbi:hypothetical protein [Roseospira goensis]|uniref:Uncharacterized protein n=1 Tax=Roseospira goensis TaxID=391922 RepID=A0A7W6S1L2_9PROT|nr:hypothetical protein [Roseospira goensis]MBB4287223.1 hypothetical protein [Roseospira goensis]